MTNTYNINPVTDHLGGSPFTRGAPDGTSDGTPDGTSDGIPDGTSWQQSWSCFNTLLTGFFFYWDIPFDYR